MLLHAAILAMAQQCAPDVAPHTMASLVVSESSGNPYAIGVVGMDLIDQPKTKEEAVSMAKSLMAQGARISGGLGQVYMGNWKNLGLTVDTVFDPCPNLTASSKVLSDCYQRASTGMGEGQAALTAAFSCYYSNNFTRGFEKEGENKPSYLMMIASNSEKLKGVPEIQFKPSDINEVDPSKKNEVSPSEPPKAIEEEKQIKTDTESSPDASMSWDVLGDFH